MRYSIADLGGGGRDPLQRFDFENRVSKLGTQRPVPRMVPRFTDPAVDPTPRLTSRLTS